LLGLILSTEFMPATAKKLRVGISIVAKENASIWNNGINQNIAFLVMLLRQSPLVEKVFLINAGKETSLPGTMRFDLIDVPIVQPGEVTHDIDLVIEMGSLIETKWLRRVHALGVKIVTFQVGHTYTINGEAVVFNKEGGLTFEEPHLRDEVWILPKSSKTCAPMLRTLTRRPVLEMPHLWSPCFLEAQISQLAETGHQFGFDPARDAKKTGGWRVGIFEPNISVVKSCFLPMLACEAAYREQPESVAAMMIINSFHMKEHPTFKHFAIHLDLTRDGRASYENRLIFADCMTLNKLDAVISHQWENEQNYLYYDALHGGYPLVHNSPFMERAGMGFYYPGFEAARGGARLVEAWEKDPRYWEDYRRRSRGFLATLAPDHHENIRRFTERIARVMEAPR